MTRSSKRTSAPPPMEIPPGSQPVPLEQSMAPFLVPWHPPCTQQEQSMAPFPLPYWLAGRQHPGLATSSAQGTWSASGGVALQDSDLQAWGSDSHPPGGFLNFLKKNTPSHTQAVSNGSPSQPINVGDDTNDGNCARTEKRLIWTKQEDLKLLM